ncbi:unnamed protein product [Symbiodinium sp. CCMP2592]|nr:unnamed protein product [Symbiodinium sp. CCMP2592]
MSAQSTGAALSSCIFEDRWQDAIQLLECFHALDIEAGTISLNSAMSICKHPGGWQTANHLVSSIYARSLEASSITYNTCMSACSEGGHWQTSCVLFSRMRDRHLPGTVVSYGALLEAKSPSCWRHVLALFLQLGTSGLESNIVTSAAVISGEIKGQWQRACALLMACTTRQIRINLTAFNAVISACEKERRWEAALHLLEELQLERIRADIISFNAVISACNAGGMWQQALALLVRLDALMMRADAGLAIFEVADRCSSFGLPFSTCSNRNTSHLSLWLMALISGPTWATVTQMPCSPPDHDRITYNAAISACEKSQEWQQALVLLGQAERQRMQLGIITYNAAISACDRGGQWELALHLLNEAVCKRLRPQLTSYNAAASACAKELRWYEAVILLGQLNEAGMEDARAWIGWGRSFQKFDAQASGLFALKPLILKLPRLATYLASMDASEISFMLGLLSEEYKKNFEIVSSLETEQPMLKLSYLSDFRHPIVAKAAPEWVADLFAAVHEEMPPTPSGSTTLLSCNMSFNESLATRFFDLMGEEAERAPRLARRRWQNRLQRQFLTCSTDEFRGVNPLTKSIALLGPVVR